MRLTDCLLTKTTKICFISVFIVLLLFSISYLIVFYAHAQQGGTATGGSATTGPVVSGPANCYGTCNYYGGPTKGGSAIGGNVVKPEGKELSSQTSKPVISSSIKYSFIKKWGSTGTGNGQFAYPSGIAVDSAGNVYIADTENNRIQKFDSNGKFIIKGGSIGNGDGQFYAPHDIAIDSSGNVYVVDTGNNRIQVFSPSTS